MHAKLHRVRITEANVNYTGSITIDRQLIDQVGILPLEEVQVWNLSNGNRLSTYVLPGEAGSGVICANGAAAHLFSPDDLAIIVAYADCDRQEVIQNGHQAYVLIADGQNNRAQEILQQSLVPGLDVTAIDQNVDQKINRKMEFQSVPFESLDPHISFKHLSKR
nr:aspartate 1-decarboxylase [Pseudanabaena sp. PCC 7367]